MSYLVTARKWRPQRFDEVIGQDHITTTIKNSLRNNRIAHAFLFAGPRGVGKTTTARLLAKSLNCLNPQNGEPCGECEMCKTFQSSQTFDVIEIDGASNRRIEEVRTLRESVKYAPTKGSYKIYIIDEVHMLTNESFNALLKTLEEPPEHTIFIFATTDVHKVPLTIVSRCQRFDFRRIELEQIKSTLSHIAKEESIEIDDKSLTIISKKGDGALRDAESLFDQVVSFTDGEIDAETLITMLNLIDEDVYFEISGAIINKDFAKAFEISQTIYKNGWNYIDFVEGLIEHFRNIMTVVISKNSDLIEAAKVTKDKYTDYKDSFSEGDLIRILDFLNKSLYELKSATNQKLKVEVALCHLIGLEKSSTLSEVLSKLGNTDLGESKKKVVQPKSQSQKNPEAAPHTKATENQISPEVPQNYSQEESKTTYGQDKTTQPTSQSTKQTQNFTGYKELGNNWKEFTQFVHSGKFSVGSLLSTTKIDRIEGTTVYLSLDSEEDWKIIQNDISYIKQRAKEFSGKDYEFEFAGSKSKGTSDNLVKEAKEDMIKESSTSGTLINAVKEKLRGREIT